MNPADHTTSQRYGFALAIVRTLRSAGYQALFAGGCVRDQLLGRIPKDYDVATSAAPEQIMNLLGRHRTVPVGAAFGVVMVPGSTPAEGAVEVARRDELPAAMVDNAWPAPNWVAGAVLGADDTGEIAARARASGCLVASHAGRIYIDTRPQLGCWLVVERTA